MMTNERILKSKMILKGYSGYNALSEAIGLSRMAIFKKRKGINKWTTGDITKIKEVLDLTNNEVMEIFFGGNTNE